MPIFTLKLTDRHEVARNTIELRFAKPAGFTYTAGQYGGFTLINPSETDAGGITRRFSLLSSPSDDYLAIATRIQNSAYKRVLANLPIGSDIKFAGPTGNFILHDEISVPTVLIAGGIGIAPFYSMMRFAASQNSSRQIILFYGNQTRDDAAYLDQLVSIEQQHSAIKTIAAMANPDATWQGETGYITHTMIKKYVPDISQPIFYVCGSPAMVTAIQELLVEMGVADDHIKVEDFPGY